LQRYAAARGMKTSITWLSAASLNVVSVERREQALDGQGGQSAADPLAAMQHTVQVAPQHLRANIPGSIRSRTDNSAQQRALCSGLRSGAKRIALSPDAWRKDAGRSRPGSKSSRSWGARRTCGGPNFWFHRDGRRSPKFARPASMPYESASDLRDHKKRAARRPETPRLRRNMIGTGWTRRRTLLQPLRLLKMEGMLWSLGLGRNES
jgi:hypothetical protein